MNLYTFIWDDFCSWYLEWVKPPFGEPIDGATYRATVGIFEQLVKLLHPFMPFVTEEIWHNLADREENDYLIVAPYPSSADFDEEWLKQAARAKEIIAKIREIRTQSGVKQKDKVQVSYLPGKGEPFDRFEDGIKKLGGCDAFQAISEKPDDPALQAFVVKGHQFFVHTGIEVDTAAEKDRIQEEINYIRGFIQSVEKKLTNERFVSNAPEAVVDKERKKLEDGREKLQALEESLSRLS